MHRRQPLEDETRVLSPRHVAMGLLKSFTRYAFSTHPSGHFPKSALAPFEGIGRHQPQAGLGRVAVENCYFVRRTAYKSSWLPVPSALWLNFQSDSEWRTIEVAVHAFESVET